MDQNGPFWSILVLPEEVHFGVFGSNPELAFGKSPRLPDPNTFLLDSFEEHF